MARSRNRMAAIAAATSAGVLAAGCGFGPGSSTDGEATLVVTRDYGAEPMREATVSDPTESETVIRLLDRAADVETRYGGGFVQSIDGVEGAVEDGRSFDWFFYVNGVESEVGAAEVRVRGGDRIWWDHRDWTDAMRVPAVVGSFPEPFLQASAGADERLPVRVECAGERGPCETVREALADQGVDAGIVGFPADHADQALRLLVGPWPVLRADPTASQVEGGPAVSGVFATFLPRRHCLEDVDPSPDPYFCLRLEPANVGDFSIAQVDPDAGLIAAVRRGDDPVTWLVTGADAAAVRDAAEALGPARLRDHYAIATSQFGDDTPLPDATGSP